MNLPNDPPEFQVLPEEIVTVHGSVIVEVYGFTCYVDYVRRYGTVDIWTHREIRIMSTTGGPFRYWDADPTPVIKAANIKILEQLQRRAKGKPR
jgi:hypothetical protein